MCRVGVCSFPLLLRSPLRVLVRHFSFYFHFHVIFIVISSAPLLRGVCVCVCVYHLNRCKTSIICRGPPGSRGGRWPTKTPPRDPCKGTCMQWPWTATPSVGAVAGHCSDSPWAPSCAAGMSQHMYIYIYIR